MNAKATRPQEADVPNAALEQLKVLWKHRAIVLAGVAIVLCLDALWVHRWKVSLYQAFIRGADPIYSEHGIMDNRHRGHDLDAEAPTVKRYREELGKFARFCAVHPRPAGYPRTRLAILHRLCRAFIGRHRPRQ